MFALLFSFLLFINPVQESDTLTVTSEISDVTVFQNQAQIHRTQEVKLKSGITTVVFEGLSEFVNTESIQLKGDGRYTLLSLTTRNNYTEEQTWSGDVKQLRIQREELQSVIETKNAETEVVNSEIELLNATQEIIKNNKLSSTELNELLTLYRTNLSALLNKRNALRKEIQKLNSDLRDIQQQINESGQVERSRFVEVVAEIQSETAQTLDFDLTYLVYNAGWTPTYDIRSKDISSPMEISYKANIYQNTGIDWKDVTFTINSGDPSSSAIKPELNPFRLGWANQNSGRTQQTSSNISITSNGERGIVRGRVFDRETGETLPGTNVSIIGTTQGAATNANGSFELPVLSNGRYSLRFDFIGFKSITVPLTISNNGYYLTVPLEEEMVMGEEVVVASVPIQSGISIRGVGSVAAYSQPLYVVDGEIMSNDEATNLIQEIGESNVASMDVLKGNEATNLYGSKASGGVIIITTKREALITSELTSNQTSFSYEIGIPYSVPSDGKEHTVEIKREKVDASYTFSTVPKLSNFAYLVGNIPDWNKLNLIEGNANIYFDNSFVGTTFLSPEAFEDSLAISLGKDERIVIERNKRNEFSKKNFFRNKVRELYSYEINIRNTKSETITIDVEDQIPLSTNGDINVSNKELSGGTLDEETGLINWKMTLAPGTTKTLILEFEIEYPKGKRINY